MTVEELLNIYGSPAEVTIGPPRLASGPVSLCASVTVVPFDGTPPHVAVAPTIERAIAAVTESIAKSRA
jgi:hypothetical protein